MEIEFLGKEAGQLRVRLALDGWRSETDFERVAKQSLHNAARRARHDPHTHHNAISCFP